MTKWQMEISNKKCAHMRLGKDPKLQTQYTIGGTHINETRQQVHLGVTFQSNLKWDAHVKNVKHKATKMMGFLQRNIKGCSRYTKIAAYKTYVRPVLEYAATVWDPAETAHIHNLEMVQRRGARFTMGLAVNTGDSISISRTLLSLKWPALSIRRRIRRLTMFHGIYQGQNRALQPLTLETEKLKADGRTRRHSKLKHVFRNSNVGKFSFFPKSIRDWNQLPATITGKQGKDSFRREATDFYCQKEFNNAGPFSFTL